MAEETTPSLNSSNNTTNVQSSKVPAGRFSGHSLASACSSAIKSYLNNVNNHANPMKTLENAANSGPLLDEASNQTIPPTSLKNTNRQLGEQLLLEEVGNHAIGTKQQTLSPTSFVNTNRQLSGHLLLEEVGDHAIGTQQQTLPRVILEDNSRQLGIPILEEVSTHTNTQNPLENSSRLLDGALVLEEGQDTGVDRRMLSRNDREEEEDSSDICSLPECDSDLLEVNPDAPHINSPADVVLPSFEGVTPSSYQGVLPIPSNTAHLHDGDDDEQHSLIAVVNSENIERLIESVNTEAVGVLVFNAHDDTAHQGGYESGVDSELNNSPICIYSSPEASPCPVDVVPSAAAYANETVNEKLPTPLVFQDNTLSEDRIGSSGVATADDVVSGSCEKRTVQLMEIEPINESTIETPSLLVTASAKQSPVPLAAATKRAGTSADVIPSTTPFLLMQKMLKGETDFHLPPDTKRWSTDEVSQFLRWLVGILRTEGPLIPYDEFQIDGKLLFKIRKRNLQRLFPESAVDVLWMHVEALKFASVTALNNPSLQAANAAQHKLNVGQQQQQKQLHTSSKVSMNAGPANRAKASTTEGYSSPGSGQIQLWQFLLELLTERNMGHTICWVGDEGAFKLVDPERVAQLWGERKNKPSMNYEKLSRALRYYYDGDLIHKVCGKRFVYQFVCDLKMLLGYSAAELSKLVNER